MLIHWNWSLSNGVFAVLALPTVKKAVDAAWFFDSSFRCSIAKRACYQMNLSVVRFHCLSAEAFARIMSMALEP